LPALIVVLITEAFYIRGVLTYAIGGAIVGCACYLGLIPVRSETMPLRWHCAPPSRNPDRGGHRRGPGLLDDRRPQRGRLARTAAAIAVATAAGRPIRGHKLHRHPEARCARTSEFENLFKIRVFAGPKSLI